MGTYCRTLFTVDRLSRVLRLGVVEIREAVTDLRILSLRTSDGLDLFPSFQVQDGRVHPGLQSCLRFSAAASTTRDVGAVVEQ